ncbi:MAG: aspartate carbamoyltransferase catalytic subunit [Oscillospiraceae bacterium]|nr:aspartate carbamoyltransferase catalytic subunit [Oscillospiraceae bacterium]
MEGFVIKNLNTLDEMSLNEIESILENAQKFSEGLVFKRLADKIAVNLFFEPSTRTHYSFEIAERKLFMSPLSFFREASSLVKNETFFDTVRVFDSFCPDVLVVRSSEEAFYKSLINKLHVPIINAGDGTGSHPTQSLLDLLTIIQEFGSFERLSVAIIGDVKHSRVAHENFKILTRIGCKVYTSGPAEISEKNLNYIDFNYAIKNCDIIYLLRIQHERHHFSKFCFDNYNKIYGLNFDNINLLKPGAVVMHPGPVNRDVEIESKLVEHPRSRIFKQVKNGVFVRMAVLRYVLE